MKLLSIVVCCGSCDGAVVGEGRSLVAQPPSRPRGRKRWRAVAIQGGGDVTNVADWRPSLTSISEDDNQVNDQRKQQPQKEVYPEGSQMIKRRIESSPKPRTRQDSHHYREHVRQTSFSAMFPALAPTPFMF